MTDFVAYYRVSTDRQGASGLGLDAQREAVRKLVGPSGSLLVEYTEVESGRRHTNRPQLQAALDECRKRRATLLIARLDRLARNVAFISGLMESGADFIAADMPEANRLTIHILAAVAEHEQRLISQRTKAALAQAKARGTKLGSPRPMQALAKANAATAHLKPAREVVRLIKQRRDEGKTLRDIAQELNRLGNRTPRGKQWYASTVRNQIEADRVAT